MKRFAFAREPAAYFATTVRGTRTHSAMVDAVITHDGLLYTSAGWLRILRVMDASVERWTWLIEDVTPGLA